MKCIKLHKTTVVAIQNFPTFLDGSLAGSNHSFFCIPDSMKTHKIILINNLKTNPHKFTFITDNSVIECYIMHTGVSAVASLNNKPKIHKEYIFH